MNRLLYYFTIIWITVIGLTACSDDKTPVEPSIKLISTNSETSVSEDGMEAESIIEAKGGTFSIGVEANVGWDAEVASGKWCAVTSASDGKLEVAVCDNKSGDKRSARIYLSSIDKSVSASLLIVQDGAEKPSIKILMQNDDKEIVFPEDGGTYTVSVEAADGWTLTTDARWCSIDEDKQNNTFTVSVVENHTFSLFTGSIFVHSGNGDNESVIEIPISQKCVGDAMIMTLKADAQSENVVALPFNKNDGYVNCIVDWGDGTMQHVCYSYPQHEYAQAGTYKVRILGRVDSFMAANLTYMPDNMKNCIIGIDHWGNIGLKLMKKAFYKCQALEYMAEPEDNSFTNVTTFYEAFWECQSLTVLPEGLFKNAPNVTTMYEVFSGCESLTAIPDNFFSNCPKVTTFFRAFWHNFALTKVGKDAFKNCAAVTTIGQMFVGCNKLQTVPVDIFDDMVKLANVAYTFSGCTELSCESPYTLLNGEKVHLYERINHTDVFNSLPATGTAINGCFEDCVKMEDYSLLASTLPYWINYVN